MDYIFYYLKFILIFLLGYFFNFITYKVLIFIYVLYCTYNYLASKTHFYYNKDANHNFIHTCLKLKFKPYFFIPNALLQLLFFPFISTPTVEFDTQLVNDYGVCLKWVKLNYKLNSNQPILILIPGIAGTEDGNYILNTISHSIKFNYRIVVYINSLVTTNIKLPEDRNLDLIDDFHSALLLIKKKYNNSKIYAIGFSYGANVLVNYLGTYNTNSKIINGGVSVSNPFDLLVCQRTIKGTIYETLILKLLKNLVRVSLNSFKKVNYHSYDAENALIAKNLKEYDELLIRRILGYKSADDYYRNFSSYKHILDINVPLLCINSLDDTITSSLAIPYDEIISNKNVFLITTTHGSHLCWISNDKFFSLKQWIYKPIVNFILSINNK